MNIKFLIVLIILVGLCVGGVFVYKNLVTPKAEREGGVSLFEEVKPEGEITTPGVTPPEGEKEEEEKSLSGQPKKELKFEWEEDEGERVSDGSVPFVHKLADGRFRLYYCGKEGIVSAISSDGLNFGKEPGIRIDPVLDVGNAELMVCDPTIIDLPDGKIRMYYKGATGSGGPGQAVHKVFSAISSDGLNFQKEGLRIDSERTGDDGWASVPEAVKLPDGRVRIYYVSDASSVGHGIVSAVSLDGLDFIKEETKLTSFVDPAVIILFDGKYLLFAKSFMGKGIYSFISSDGINFEDQQLVISEESYDPSIIQLDNSTYRVFYGCREPVTKSITGHLR